MTASVGVVRATTDAPDMVVETRHSIAWGAVIAGAMVGLAVSICLSLAGAAMGLSLVEPWDPNAASAKSISIGALIWLFVVNLVGMGIGGFIAGRGARMEITTDPRESTYRYTVHGLTMWALATVVAGSVGLSAIAGAIGMVGQGAATAAGAAGAGAAAGVAGGAAAVAKSALDDDDGDVGFQLRQLFGPARPAPGGATPEITMFEAQNIMERAWDRGELAPSDKTYLASVVAQQAGISQQEAEQRVAAAEQRLKATIAEITAKAKDAADAAAKTGAIAAFLAFLGLALGAAAAVIGSVHFGPRRPGYRT
jgi:hypothetical protein